MISVTFSHVDPGLARGGRPLPDQVVAWFDRDSGGPPLSATLAALGDLHGVSPLAWPRACWPRLVEALCRPVRAAPLSPGGGSSLDLPRRFEVHGEGPGGALRIRGFASLDLVDRELLVELFGPDGAEPGAWSEALGSARERLAWRHALTRLGLGPEHLRRGTQARVRPHAALSPLASAGLLVVLAPARERFREAVRQVVLEALFAGAGRVRAAGPPAQRLVHLSARGGRTVVCRGRGADLHVVGVRPLGHTFLEAA